MITFLKVGLVKPRRHSTKSYADKRWHFGAFFVVRYGNFVNFGCRETLVNWDFHQNSIQCAFGGRLSRDSRQIPTRNSLILVLEYFHVNRYATYGDRGMAICGGFWQFPYNDDCFPLVSFLKCHQSLTYVYIMLRDSIYYNSEFIIITILVRDS